MTWRKRCAQRLIFQFERVPDTHDIDARSLARSTVGGFPDLPGCPLVRFLWFLDGFLDCEIVKDKSHYCVAFGEWEEGRPGHRTSSWHYISNTYFAEYLCTPRVQHSSTSTIYVLYVFVCVLVVYAYRIASCRLDVHISMRMRIDFR